MESFPQDKSNTSKVIVTESISTTRSTSNAVRTRSGRTSDTLRQTRGRSKTFTGNSSLNGPLINASWPSPSHSNNPSTNNKNPLGISHFSSSPNLSFGGTMNSSPSSSSYVFGSGTNVFASSSQQSAHRNSDNEEAMDIDSQDDMDTQIGQTATQIGQTATSSTVTTPISSTSLSVPADSKESSAGSSLESKTTKGNNVTPKHKDVTPSSPKVSVTIISSPSPQLKTAKKIDKKKANVSPSPSVVTAQKAKSLQKGSGKKKAIYIVLHVGTVLLGDLKGKALAPIKIYAEKIFMEIELAEGQKSMLLRIPFNDLLQCMVSFDSPNPVVAFTLTQSGAKTIVDKNKDKKPFLGQTEDCSGRHLVLNMNCNSIPRDVKADLIELFQNRMSDKLSWTEMSASELKTKLQASSEAVKPLVQPTNDKTEKTQEKVNTSTTTASPTMTSPSAGSSIEGRKILTPKKSTSARRKLYERTASSPAKSNIGTSNDSVEEMVDGPEIKPVEEPAQRDSHVIQTRSRRRGTDDSNTEETMPSSTEEEKSTSSIEPENATIEMSDSSILGLRDSSSKLRDNPSRLRDSPSKLRDNPSKLRDSPSRSRDGSSRLRGSPSRLRDSPTRLRDSPSRMRDGGTETRDPLPTSPGVKRDIFSRLTSGDVRDIFPTLNDQAFPTTSTVTPSPRNVRNQDVTSTSDDPDVTCNASFNGYRDATGSLDVTPPFERDSKMCDVLHQHDQMESHINELGKHSEKQRYTLEQHQILLSLERAERIRNIETIRDLRLSLGEREHLITQQRDEIALLNREIESGGVALRGLQQELEQERESSSRHRKLQSDLVVARRALDEERVVRNLREQQLQDKERASTELQGLLSVEAQARRNLESELRNVRSACLQHMDELENQRLFRQTQDREIQGREDRITATERRHQEEYDARLRLEEDLRQLRLERDGEKQSKDTLQGELTRERERITNERARIENDRQTYEQRLEANELRRAQLEEQLRGRDTTIAQTERHLRELQTAVSSRQSMLDECRRIEPRDWLIRREEVTLTEVTLGTGAWGTVKVGKFRGSKVAVKQIHELILSPHNRRLFEREMSIASRCRHPCLLQFIGATNDDGIPLFLTEILDSDLRAILSQRALHQEEIITIALDCARALNYLHLNKPYSIIHRDISSSNVLIWKRDAYWRAKLSDYGAANFMRQYMTVNPGASIYAAPEASTSQQSAKVDVYSFGLLLCEMCIRELPVPQQTQEQVSLITSGVLRELVVRSIQRDPEARPSMSDVITLLEQQEASLRDRGLVHPNA